MINEHFLARYNAIIGHYKTTVVEGFVEKHHITPKCMGGDDSYSNLVALPPRAHIICHYILHKAYPENKSLAYAFSMMAVNNKSQYRRMSSRLYEKTRTARSSALKGVKLTEEQKAKLRVPKKNKQNYKGKKSESHRKNISAALTGISRTAEHQEKLNQSMQSWYEEQRQQTATRNAEWREEFLNSGMNRREFAIHKGVSYTTVKVALKGV